MQHSTYSELYAKREYFDIDFDKVKIISVLRNPYDRIVSDLFFFKLININSTRDEVYQKLCYFLNSNELIYDNHKMEQYKYLFFENKICELIILLRTETLDEDMKKNGYMDFNLKSNVSNKDSLCYMDMLNEDSIKLINEYYKLDFEYFGYAMIKI